MLAQHVKGPGLNHQHCTNKQQQKPAKDELNYLCGHNDSFCQPVSQRPIIRTQSTCSHEQSLEQLRVHSWSIAGICTSVCKHALESAGVSRNLLSLDKEFKMLPRASVQNHNAHWGIFLGLCSWSFLCLQHPLLSAFIQLAPPGLRHSLQYFYKESLSALFCIVSSTPNNHRVGYYSILFSSRQNMMGAHLIICLSTPRRSFTLFPAVFPECRAAASHVVDVQPIFDG